MIQCIDCDTWFEVIWHRNLIYDRIYYCPFCGCEFNEEDLEEMVNNSSEE